MHIDLIGIGMEGNATLTAQAGIAIGQAEVLIGAQRMLDTVPPDDRERFSAYDPTKIADFLNCSAYGRAAVLLSGDVGFFSGAKRLTEVLKGHDVQLIPGISSVVYFCAKAAIPWENMKFVSLHGTDSSITVHAAGNERTFFLLGGALTAALVCRRLCDYGLEDVRVHIGARLGYPDEQIITGSAAALCGCETEHLSVMITENPDFIDYLPTCIPDEEFVRGTVPMTKAEVRGVSVSSLHIVKNAVCWDIGCGTGSVSVEMALRCPDGRVYAIDKNPEAAALSIEQSRKFHCDNISVTQGDAPEGLAALPAPDCVFIGGSSGTIQAIFDVIWQKNPDARIAVNAVTLETLQAAQAAFRTHGGHCRITQLAVTQTRTVGSSTMLQAQNPVFLLQGVLR